jgi:hypothetical protein
MEKFCPSIQLHSSFIFDVTGRNRIRPAVQIVQTWYHFYLSSWECKWNCLFLKVCKSVHHRTTQINHQPDATIFQFIILTFIYSSTCFGRSPAHHQQLNDCSGSLWFYLSIVVIAVLCSWSGRPGPSTNTAQLSPRYEGKTRGYYCSHWAPDDGRENSRNMLSCK